MIRRGRPTFLLFAAVVAGLICLQVTGAAPVRADEEDDLQRQVDTQKAGVPDLEQLDKRRAATADIQRLKEWIALAWDLRNKHDPDGAREVLDRCLSQAELIRQIIAASLVKADVGAREAKLQQTRQQIEREKKELRDAQAKKKATEKVVGS
ncbi:MAG: hypothetical protein H7X95_00840 [Deltaproteobacteria bacterium]|nr:hypothetical protein [Deltaproteobacteria bacterium]